MMYSIINRNVTDGGKGAGMAKGHLYWITGLSGAGKTTISTLLYQYLKEKKDNVVFLDGDKTREVYQNTDYSDEGREKITHINQRLCKMLTDQGIDVVCAFIAMKNIYRQWNRENIENYTEIYLEVPMEVLFQRDSKGLYKRALNKEITNVYGVDMPFEAPAAPDIKVINDGAMSPDEVCRFIVDKIGI